jgi:xanthine dehydrogenase accessory factor
VKDIIDTLERWTGQGASVALGSVVERIGSAPRDPGAALAVSSNREVAGGVTGGCVEPAVIREANEVLGGSRGKLLDYGLDDEDGFDVGLTCGGRIAIAVYRLDPELVPPIADAVRSDSPIAVTLRLGEEHFGEQSIWSPEGTNGDAVSAAARSLLEIGESAIVDHGGEKVFVETYAPRANLYLFGASDHVAALVPIGRQLGYRVTVCDPRKVFLTRERFPDADELTDEWPDEFLARAPIDPRTAICMMTHDLKFDVPALKLALTSEAGFIGAIGSEKTRADRTARLHEEGVTDEQMSRLHAPVGIHIGARTPDEVAVSIAAQLIESNVAVRRSRIETISRATVLV